MDCNQKTCLGWLFKKDLSELPKDIVRKFGQGLRLVQLGGMPLNAKVLQGFGGASVLELRIHDQVGTYRAVDTVRFSDALYVLHVFQKKARKGIATDQHDIELIKSRLKDAQTHYAKRGTSQEA